MSLAVSAELRAALARKRYTVARLVKESGLPKSTLHKTLNGQRVVDVEDLYSICRFLGIEPADVVRAASKQVEIEASELGLFADVAATVDRRAVGGADEDPSKMSDEEAQDRYDLAADHSDAEQDLDERTP